MSGIRKSKVWRHFEMVKYDPKKVRCKLFQQLMSYHSTTTSMALYLKRVRFFNNTLLRKHKTVHSFIYINALLIYKYHMMLGLIKLLYWSTRDIRLISVNLLVVKQRHCPRRPPLSEKRKRVITDKIAEFVALDMRPVNIVEGEGFKDWMHTLEPGYNVPKREAVMHAVDAKYMSIRAEIFRLKHCEAVSLTTDIWTPAANGGLSDSYGPLYY